MGDVLLCDRMFSRLFDLFENRLATVSNMLHLAWEEDFVKECCFVLHNIVLQKKCFRQVDLDFRSG